MAAVVAFFGALPLATARWYLLPVLLVPLAVALWAWRSGTDVDDRGLRLRAVAGSHRIPWSQVAELGPDPRGRAAALLTDGRTVVLPAVRAADLPRVIAASGQQITGAADAQ
ncbi:PH domain-containing protein [Micromonospora pattaloongensis]|uniref:PH domain-containing protein n=1 Tax=Micromonospora pattaloongensis TaxID=405436 RepID=A0A1H3KXM0_9ACTN|nr:PH domain-containing protein [Micromonospora pattaloongensis]